MKMKLTRKSLVCLMLAAFAGCASYTWKGQVPEDCRTLSVPVFENRTQAAELGPIVTQYTLREVQREGTFKIRRSGDAALEVQGAIVKAERHPFTYDRSRGTRAKSYRYVVTAEVSVIDKRAGKVLVNNRKYVTETTFLTQGDLLTGQRNAAPRIGEELGRQIVDDLVAWQFK